MVLDLLDLSFCPVAALVEEALALILIDVIIFANERLKVDATEKCFCLFDFSNVRMDDILLLLDLIFNGGYLSTALGSDQELTEEVKKRNEEGELLVAPNDRLVLSHCFHMLIDVGLVQFFEF